jgi:DNA-binding response OmpR family regulator
LILEYIAREKAKQKKTKGQAPFVIMITGNPGERHKSMAESMGANIYLKKPVSLPKLLAEATRLLAGPTPPVAKVG